jgi:hypothetical protein
MAPVPNAPDAISAHYAGKQTEEIKKGRKEVRNHGECHTSPCNGE